jgi:hypothetical protein
MHGSFERLSENNDRIHRSRDVGFLAIPILVAIVLVGVAMTQPAASNWIAEAAQAEFVGPGLSPEAAQTQLAQPAGEMHTARSN